MDVRTIIILLSVNGEQKSFTDITVAELIEQLWKSHPQPSAQREILALLRPDIGIHFLYDPYEFSLLKFGNRKMEELMEKHWFHGLYRNKVTLKGKFESEVESGSLWILRDDKLILANDDWTVVESLNDAFYSVI